MGGGCTLGPRGGKAWVGERAGGGGVLGRREPAHAHCPRVLYACCTCLRGCWVAGPGCPHQGRRGHVHQPSHQHLAIGGRL